MGFNSLNALIILYVAITIQYEPIKLVDLYAINFSKYMMKNEKILEMAKYKKEAFSDSIAFRLSNFQFNFNPKDSNCIYFADSTIMNENAYKQNQLNCLVNEAYEKMNRIENYYFDIKYLEQFNSNKIVFDIFYVKDDLKRFTFYDEYYRFRYGVNHNKYKIDIIIISSVNNVIKSFIVMPLRFDAAHDQYNFSVNYEDDTINIYKRLEEKIDFENEFIISNNPDSNRYKLDMVYKITSEGFLVNEYYRTPDDDWEEGDAYH